MIRGVRAARELLPLSGGERQEGFMEEVPWELECGDQDRGIQAEKGRECRQGGSGSSGPGSRRVGLMGGGHGRRLGFWRVEAEDSGQCLPVSERGLDAWLSSSL